MNAPAPPPSLHDLRDRIAAVMIRDVHALRRKLDRVRSTKNDRERAKQLETLAGDVARAEAKLHGREQRAQELREPRYPDLPIVDRKDDIAAAIRDNQVVIVAGETGSGKSTQLPKICLEIGRGVLGLVGHTQPRRLAARSIAERIAEELQTPLGHGVGYTVRFTDQVGEDTLVKVMTDGILLAEIQRDRWLNAYDTIIVDEAHERSLNIDFILGYLKQLLPKRPELKVIVTSATIDTERFSRHFDDAPIIEVSGRTYPVEVRYRPLDDERGDGSDAGDRDQTQAICEAVAELSGEGPGDVLVFLSGEREIRDTADAVRKMNLRDTEILPLYARLSAGEQHRVFQPHSGRRVVLATNVAETSLTVPGVRYVVDAGTARISRYSRRTKVQRLPIEAISRASANQRAGRCGRVAPGVCIRLYSEEDFEARPEFTEAEILRTNLASVILQMATIGLGDVAAFPFVDPPESRNVKDGIDLLEELGALKPGRGDLRKRLTRLGRQLAQIPLDPRLARMVVEADSNACLHEVMIIAAGLAIQDPRERPVEKQQVADEHNRRFADPESDFVSFLNLWTYLQERQRELSGNQFRRLCKAEFLNYLRVREWQDIYSQLRQVTRSMGMRLNHEPADRDAVHISLLAGLLSHIGMRDGERQEYIGARNARFAISPGSALFKKAPRWVMAAELVETTRLWARVAGRIQPEWAEKLGGQLVKRNYSEPRWDAGRGTTIATERVTLYGIPIVVGRKVNYAPVEPDLARELFIQHALVERDWEAHHAFLNENEELVAEVRALEHRARRGGLLAGEDAIFDFYDERIPDDAVSAAHFESWWKKTKERQPGLLTLSLDVLLNPDAPPVDFRGFPDTWPQGDLDLALAYEYEPGSDTDGVTVLIPLPVLNQVQPGGFDWQVPGLRHELVTELIRSLPKAVRRNFVPANDYATKFLERYGPGDGPLLDVLERELPRLAGEGLPRGSWDLAAVPDYLTMTFAVTAEDGRMLAYSKDLNALKERLARPMRSAISRAAAATEKSGARSWAFGDIPRVVEVDRGAHSVRAFPALVDEGDSVGLRLLSSEDEQHRAMRAGTRRLLVLTLPSPRRIVEADLRRRAKFALARAPHATLADLLDDCIAAAVDRLVEQSGGPAWDEAEFEQLRQAVRDELADAASDIATTVARILVATATIESRVDELTSSALMPSVVDIRAQIARLTYPGFVADAGRRLDDIPRYLEAVERRLDKLPAAPAKDLEIVRRVQQLEDEYADAIARRREPSQGAADIRWMIEELRVSLFAQALGTAYPVSEKRVRRALEQL